MFAIRKLLQLKSIWTPNQSAR